MGAWVGTMVSVSVGRQEGRGLRAMAEPRITLNPGTLREHQEDRWPIFS